MSRFGALVAPSAMAAPKLVPSVTPLRPAEVLSDAELVERALRDRNGWAEGVIYQRHASELANLAARLLRDRTEALDVVQQVFVDALENLSSLREPAALRAWLRRCTLRQVHRIFRRRKIARLFGLRNDDEHVGLDAFASPTASPEVRAELARVSEILDTLPDRARIAWMLHHVEGETLPAVAEACGVSLATAKRDIATAHRAVTKGGV